MTTGSTGAGASRAVLVTGASRGLGRESALALAAAGFHVWAGVRRLEDGAGIEQEAAARGLPVRAVRIDVADPASAAGAVAGLAAAGPPLYGLVNNAAVTLRGYFEDLADEEIRRLFDVNLFGTMHVTRAVVPHLRAAGRGRIVIMSSVGGRIGSMGLSAYVASKFALEGFGESLHLELAPLGIGVSIVEPGIVRTDIWGDNRQVAAAARNPEGVYYRWFRQAEAEADALVKSATVTPPQVAARVVAALTADRPKLRYIVGWRVRLVFALRRHLPGDLFERLYFREVMRRVTAPSRPVAEPTGGAG